MRTDWQAIVLGLGGIGSGALYWLARRLGDAVLGIEQFELGHGRGGSEDHSRIIRYSYHTPHYVGLAKAAYRAWAEVERDSGAQLVHRVGGLDLFPPGGAIPLVDYTSSLEAQDVPFELLDDSEVLRRFPAFAGLDGVIGLYQADGGWVAASRANAAHRQRARELGAVLLERTAVESVRAVGDEVEVRAGGRCHRAQRLVVAAGAWSNRVLGSFGIELPLVVTEEQVTYFEPRDPEVVATGRLPVWIWMDDPSFYGFPLLAGHGVKVARDVGGEAVTAENRRSTPSRDGVDRVRGFLERYLPAVAGREILTKTCLYTLTPDRDFVVDRVSASPNVVVAIGAGHAFKFASVLGKALGELALDETPAFDLAPFAIDRPVLLEADPPTRYMV